MFALRPWLQRFRPDVPLDDAVRARLVGWASATQAEYKAAVSSRALGDLVRGWQKTREDLLTRALLEAIEATK